MKTILIINQKGGVGKTTIADELAFALSLMGYSVAFTNLDPQGGTVHEPMTPTGNEDFQIVDTPGALNQDFIKWCSNADLLLFPALPSERDKQPLKRCFTLLKQAKIPFNKTGVVVNRYDPRRAVDNDFMNFLKDNEFPLWGTMPTATAFSKSAEKNTSVFELSPKSKASQSIKAIAKRVVRESGIND